MTLRNMFRRGTHRVPFGIQLVLPALLLVLLQHRSLVSACRHESAMRWPATTYRVSPRPWPVASRVLFMFQGSIRVMVRTLAV